MFKIAICDDEIAICSYIENVILDYKKCYLCDIETEVFYSGESLCKTIEDNDVFDLIFLDIEMHALSGVEVGKIIRIQMNDYNTKIIYISGKDTYDRQLFDIYPLHFLSKPLSAEKIIDDIQIAIRISDKFGATFCYKKNYERISLYIKDILYFESLDRKVKVVFTTGEDEFYGSMVNILPRITGHHFIQIHRSYIINYNYVSKFKYDEVVMINGTSLPISQSNKKHIRKLQVMFEKDV